MTTLPDRPRVLALANQKGGVGKTTTAINLGTALAAIGEEVLIVDLDPQGNASTGLGVDRRSRPISTYDVLVGEARIDDALVETAVPRLTVAPSTLDNLGVELEIAQESDRAAVLAALADHVGHGTSVALSIEPDWADPHSPLAKGVTDEEVRQLTAAARTQAADDAADLLARQQSRHDREARAVELRARRAAYDELVRRAHLAVDELAREPAVHERLVGLARAALGPEASVRDDGDGATEGLRVAPFHVEIGGCLGQRLPAIRVDIEHATERHLGASAAPRCYRPRA